MPTRSGMVSRLLLGACVFTSAALADLVPASPFEVNINGTGFGNVSTLITLQTANGQSTTEAGCIGFGNSTTNCGIATDGKIKNTSSTEPVPSGATASDLRFVFNASQPHGGSISLTDLMVNFYGTTSTPIFTASIPAGSLPLTLTSTQQGPGNSGFVFELSSSEAAALQPLLSSVTQIGAGFSATGASGGQDTLFLETAPNVVPEPRMTGIATIVLLTGMLIAGRRKRLFVEQR